MSTVPCFTSGQNNKGIRGELVFAHRYLLNIYYGTTFVLDVLHVCFSLSQMPVSGSFDDRAVAELT